LPPLFPCPPFPLFLWGIWWQKTSKSSHGALPSVMSVIELKVYCLGIKSSEVKSLLLFIISRAQDTKDISYKK
jgi:hypothetical protein